MPFPRALTPLPLLLIAAQPTCQELLVVVPAGHMTADGNHRFWIGGAIRPERQLTLIDGSLLEPLVGRTITALSFRRNAEDTPFAAGDAHLTIQLSHAARAWSNPASAFDVNHGNDVTVVWDGPLTLPASPGVNGNQVEWNGQNALRVAFTTPFVYLGGTLAVEVTGQPGANAVDWWPADAVWDAQPGTQTQPGSGCGDFAGLGGAWSFVHDLAPVPGATATFTALGAPGSFALWAVAVAALPQAVNLGFVGAPGCFLHLQAPVASALTAFGPAIAPQRPDQGGLATVCVPIPANAAFQGTSLASQWFSLGYEGLTASNAHRWSIAAQMPTLPMTLITAPVIGNAAHEGRVIPGCGHVFLFEGV